MPSRLLPALVCLCLLPIAAHGAGPRSEEMVLMSGASIDLQGAGLPEKLVLEGVPYMGDDWERRLDGPQDFHFASAMRALMEWVHEDPALDYRFFMAVCGIAYRQTWHPTEWQLSFDEVLRITDDPLEPIRRSFEAAGYAYRIVANRALCEKNGLPLTGFDEYTDAEGVRRALCESIAEGKPPIILRAEGGGASIIAGYEDGGATVLGWALVMDEASAPQDPQGYTRLTGWLDTTAAVIVLGEKNQRLPLDEAYIKALLWAVNGARQAKLGELHSGLASFDAWAAALGRDAEFGLGDMEGARHRHIVHYLQTLGVAEGRAFGGEIAERAAERFPQAADELMHARGDYGLMHDLMWRIWQVEGGMGTGDGTVLRFVEPEVRRQQSEIVLLARDLERSAVGHIEKALLQLGVTPEEITPAGPAAEPSALWIPGTGADPERHAHDGVTLYLDRVPELAFGKGKDCTFVGALEAALSTTLHRYSYEDLMGYSGLAFRTRWFSNPKGEATTWGDMRWHPVSPHGEQPDVLQALSRATGWQLRPEHLPQANPMARERITTQIVVAIGKGLPVVAMHNTDLGVVYGYHIHSMNLLLRDYQHSARQEVRLPSNDRGFGPAYVFIDGHDEPPAEGEALAQALKLAVANGRRAKDDGFLFGLDALATWAEDLAGYDAYTDGERGLLSLCNWWTLINLLDARRAAVSFLEAHAGALSGARREALDRALSLYKVEANLVEAYCANNRDFIGWWGGTKGTADWTEAVRKSQCELLATARELEQQALEALGEAGGP